LLQAHTPFLSIASTLLNKEAPLLAILRP